MSFNIHRGTNISHWLSQSKARGEQRRANFTQDDVKRIAGFGFDHIRLPIDEVQMWDEQGNKEPEAFELLDAAIDWCRQENLRVVVDLHILRSHYFNDAGVPALWTDPAEAERFGRLWQSLSEHLRCWPNNLVAYELKNEAFAPDDADWNRVYRHGYDAVRSAEAQRTIVIGSNRWNSPDRFGWLDVPEGDRNLILTFHFYQPMLVTHYRAGWNPVGPYDGPIQYPGMTVAAEEVVKLTGTTREAVDQANYYCDQAAMRRLLAPVLAVRRYTGLPLYCGEFGVIHRAPMAVRKAWYSDFMSLLRAEKIAWANWDYKGGFTVLDDNQTDLLDVLMAE